MDLKSVRYMFLVKWLFSVGGKWCNKPIGSFNRNRNVRSGERENSNWRKAREKKKPMTNGVRHENILTWENGMIWYGLVSGQEDHICLLIASIALHQFLKPITLFTHTKRKQIYSYAYMIKNLFSLTRKPANFILTASVPPVIFLQWNKDKN